MVIDFQRIFPDAFSFFSRVVETQRISHSYIFWGPDGIWKLEFAIFVARSFLCGFMPPCGFCSQCVFDHHPDIFLVKRGEGDERLKVSAVREVLGLARVAPTVSHHKFILFDEAHLMTQQSFSALLKSIEEPKPSTTFFLVTTKLDVIPATILSRCVRVRLFPSDFDAIIEEKMREKFPGLDDSRKEKLISLSFMNPSILDKISPEDIDKIYEMISFLISSGDKKSRHFFIKYVDEYISDRDTARVFLDALESYILRNFEVLGKFGSELSSKVLSAKRKIELFLNPKVVLLSLIT